MRRTEPAVFAWWSRGYALAAFAALLPLVALIPGCQPEDPLTALQACQDQACRTAALLPAWAEDPTGTRSWLAGLEDPTVQATLIEGLALEHPDDAAALCRDLPEGAHARVRCERRVVRPHLEGRGKPIHQAGPRQQEAAAGPRSTTLPLLDLEPPPWTLAAAAERDAALADCEEGEPRLCARLVSRQQAESGDWEAAGLACLAGDPDAGKAYAECLFQAAEVLAESQGATGLGPAMKLCSWSSFGPMCVAHSLTLVGPEVPSAEQLTDEHIQATLDVVEAIRTASQAQPRLQANWVDRYWSSWTYSVYVNARAVDGRLLELLPAEAAPHLRVAVAARLMKDRDPATLEIEALAAELEQALAGRVEPQPGPAVPRVRSLVTNHRVQTWATDRKDERPVPAAWVMGPARRAVSDDPAVEMRLCVLEAAAQLRSPPPASFFLAPVGDTEQDRLVRWTGARIGSFLDPEAAKGLSDPEPLVQGVLDKPRVNRKGKASKPKPGRPL